MAVRSSRAPDGRTGRAGRLSGSDRQKLYDAQTPRNAKMLAEMTKGVGETEMKRLMKEYPGA